MIEPPAVAMARTFLARLYEGPPPSGRELLQALDELAVQYHRTPAGKPSGRKPDRPVKPRGSDVPLGERFPDYGYYVLSDPTKAPDGTGYICDAIDDLSDIANDLRQIVHRYEQFGADDAHWHFRFLFEIHWGVHLRELSLYLLMPMLCARRAAIKTMLPHEYVGNPGVGGT